VQNGEKLLPRIAVVLHGGIIHIEKEEIFPVENPHGVGVPGEWYAHNLGFWTSLCVHPF
jgi:hypothetical protein